MKVFLHQSCKSPSICSNYSNRIFAISKSPNHQISQLDLTTRIRQSQTCLCVGLDTDINKIPPHLLRYENPVLEFNRQIIEATLPHCVAYKINTAFYESMGSRGWQILEETEKLIPATHFKIADAKRADIGNTTTQYAKAFFEHMNFDAITASPYMGLDCIQPFLAYKDKYTILLALTSNVGSVDFEQGDFGGRLLYEEVMLKAAAKAGPEQLMFVVGATKAETFSHIRTIVPHHFLLVPGVGAQGGDLDMVMQHGMNKNIGLLVNSSREIIYASNGEDFAQKSAEAAERVSGKMKKAIH